MRYVIGLGGNAIIGKGSLARICRYAAELYRSGNDVMIVHGNGPEVGALSSLENKSLAILTAQTQAEIGIEISDKIDSFLGVKSAQKAAIVITRVVVKEHDSEFTNPSKPIGRFLSKGEAIRLKERGFCIKKLIHGYRRVVPSPMPLDIVELKQIEDLLDSKHIVIAAGGGGISVFKTKYGFGLANAVVDKDYTSSLLAIKTRADRLVLLTNVDGAFVNFASKESRLIREVSSSELRALVKAGHFEKGSMLPKVMACLNFTEKTGKIAVIGNLSRPERVFREKMGTVIVPV